MKIAFILLAIVFLIGCEDTPVNVDQIVDQSVTSADVTQANASSSDTTVAPPKDNVEVIPAKTGPNTSNIAKPRISLYWENTTEKHDERKPWSDKVTGIISKNFSIYDGAEDIYFFCPKYKSLTQDQKIKAHGEVIVGVVYHESRFKPTSRMIEKTMGIDPFTGRQVASEGLLQLSYQDMNSYGSITKDCGIDWSKDKKLTDTDPKKTIFDPLINLECGMRIYTNQLNKRKTIMRPIGKGNGLYWAVISTNGIYTQKNDIARRVQEQAAFCK